MFNKNVYVRFLKQRMYVFHFIIFSTLCLKSYYSFLKKIYESCLATSPYSPLLMIKVENILNGNAEI